MTDHDLLVCIDVKLKELKKQFDNHLKHHWAITIPLIGIAGSLVVALLIALCTK